MSVPCSVVITRGTMRTGRGHEHLARQVGGGRMRNRVVRVNDVQLLVAGDLDDLVRQREQVLRLAEQRIARRFDAMKRQPGLVDAEPHGRVAAEHVNLVSARRQHLAQFGRDDAAASHRGVADDPDLHAGDFIRFPRTTGSAHDDALGPANAGERTELGVTAFDQLSKKRRC